MKFISHSHPGYFSISDETILHQQMHIEIHIDIMHLNAIHVLARCAEPNVYS